MSDGLGAPPDGMDVDIGHAGVVWTVGARPHAMALAQVSFAVGAAAVGFGAATGSWSWGLAIAGLELGLGALFLLQARRRTRVRVDDRAITVEYRSLTGGETVRHPLDEVERIRVSPGSGGRDSCLVLDTPEGRVRLGDGRPEDELHWVARAIHAAQDAFGRREQAEGREWRFLRKVPEGLDRLRS